MFSSPLGLNKTPQSKTRRTFAPGNRLSSQLITPTSKRSFAASAFDVRNQSLNRSFQTTFFEEVSQHTIQAFGNPLPVLVTEAITERISDVSVRLEESGWASLVCGRRLLIWKFKQDIGGRSVLTHCRELTLPQSGLAHKADLVQVTVGRESQMPSALAVSPEGIVRYWPNIVHEGISSEASTDTAGQECYLLISLQPLGYIVATTTCSLVLITPTSSDGQYNVICRTLKFPQSVLAGIGRRVTTFIFGGLPSQTSETKQLIKVLSTEDCGKSARLLYVLSSSSLQKWRLAEDEPDELVFEQNLDRSLKEYFWKTIWSSSDATHIHQLKNWCLDMQPTQNGIALLIAAMNPSASHTVYYAFAFLDVSNNSMEFASFHLLKHTEKYQVDVEEKLLSYRFNFITKYGQIAYIYNDKKVFFFRVSDSSSEQDVIDASSCGSILGSGSTDGMTLFFTQYHGLISLQYNQEAFSNSSFHVSSPPKEIILKEHPVGEAADSLLSKLRSAMCQYFNKDMEKCQEAVNEIFLKSPVVKSSSELDSATLLLSTEIIDDYPVSDPRWCESVPTGDAVSSSLIILHQLSDKLKAHDYLINFLKALGLFERLSTVKYGEMKVSTRLLLCENAEKLTAAIMIRQFVVEHGQLMDDVIKETLTARKVEMKGHVTHQDMYFREVSQMHTVFKTLVEWEERMLTDETQDIVQLVSAVNNILVEVISSVLQYRQAKADTFELDECETEIQYLPWTCSEGPGGMRTLLLRQHAVNMQYMLKASDDVQVQGAIYQQIVDIINFLLDGYSAQLESIKDTEHFFALEEKYKKERNELIRPLLEIQQYERAAFLAEKFLDFDILVQLCEDTKNKEKLQMYALQFKTQDFAKFLFNWYLDKGMRNKLLQQPAGQQDDLSRFLLQHEDLSWLNDITKSNYRSAQQTLKELALSEKNYLSKRKTLLGLSKLSALVSDSPMNIKKDTIEALNCEQDLVLHQENLPDTVVEAYELDPDTMRVLDPEELIEMYISEENTAGNAYDFKIALELLQFLKKPPGDSEYESLRIHIWCKAILRNNWDEMDTNNPLEAIKDSIFFQVIELAFDQGVDLHNFIVPVEDLFKSPELSTLSENANFNFLIRAGYEHIYKLLE